MASSNNCEEMMLPDGTAAFRNSVLKECSDHLASTTLKYERESFVELFLQDEVFLGKLFRLFDHDRDGLLMPDEWIQLLRCRLTPDNYTTDLINQVENLISHNPIDFASFQKIFSNVEIVEKLLKVIGSSSGGEHQENQFMEFITFVTDPILPVAAAGFDKSSLEWLEKIFKQTVGNEREIHREEFKKIVISKNPFFTERVFQIFDKDNSGTISLHEFLDAMHQFAGKTPNDKIRFLFKVYDIDGDGLIQHRELQHVMRACMEENEMTFSDEQIEDLTLALFEDADQRNTGAITFEALKKQLEKHEGLLENLSISIDRWMVPPKLAESRRQTLSGLLSALKPYQLTKPYMKNNYVFIGFIWLLISINLVLFVSRLYVYRLAGAYIMIARACGQCLNFNCTLVLVLTLRQCITFLRTHGFISILPLDHHIYLHKVVGIVVGALSIVHTLAHLVNFGTVVINDEILNHSHYSMSEWILTTRPGLFGLVGGEANPTGIALLVILFVMTICSMPFVRRGGCFEIFYWSHLLYLPFWILLIFHAPNFWKWFVLPGSICMVERVRRFMWLRSQRGKTYISSGLLLPSRVTHLVIKRPQHLMDFCPGDYVFVNVPVIAKYEWHPFTISSAPEQEDYMWLHIRAVGEWTNSLYAYFEKEQQKLAEKERQQSVTAFDNRCFVADDEHNAAGASRKIPLMEKSFSMPDMHHKKKEQLMALRDYARSERSFNEAEIRRARLKAYLTPQNKSLAHSFKYIRNKPTIIAFETSSDGSVGCAALAAAEEGRRLDNKPLDIFLDGPYGAPSSHIFQAQHAVLIATGIGVTPFASILQSIMHRYWKARHTCPKCNFAWASEIPVTVMNLRKVDFFWINRDQRSFEWFVNLLSQLEIEQAELGATMERFLEMHMYITSALQKNDMKAVGLQLAMDLLHEKEKRDLITGLKTRTIAGRPNWDKVFQQLYNQKKGKVTVFYCGPSQLARILRYKCHQFGFHFRKESF